MGIVFQRHKINNYSTSRISRDRGRSLCARLLWEFSNPRVICEVSHACCCGVCPVRSLSLSASVARRLPFFSVFLTHPLSLRLPRPFTSSLFLLSRRIVGLWERKDIASIGVLVRVCGRWRLLWQGESEIRGWWLGAELKRIQVIAMKQLYLDPCAVACAHCSVLVTGLVVRSHFFVSLCLRASVFFFFFDQLTLLAWADCCCSVLWASPS